MLFKNRKYEDAEAIYHRILELEHQNVDAINSVAYCIKFKAAASGDQLPNNLFKTLHEWYMKSLEIYSTDVEANFNLGLLYLQFGGYLNKALACFEECVKRDDGTPD